MVHRRWTILSAAIVVLVAAACSDQHATPGAPGPAIREGARVSAQGTAHFHFVNGGTDTTIAWASSAVVKRGVAMAARRQAPTSLTEAAAGLLPQLAVADRAAPVAGVVRDYTFTDTTKHHTYRLVATPGPAAGVPGRLESFVDGDKVMQTDFTWTRDVGGWRAQSAHIIGYYHGAVLTATDVAATSAEVAAASFNLTRPFARLGAALLPTELRAMRSTICTEYWAAYGFAWGAYSISAAALYLEPWNIILRVEYVYAASVYAASEVALFACIARGG